MKHTLLRCSATMIVAVTLAACGTTSSRQSVTAPSAILDQQVAQPQIIRKALGQGIYELAYSARQNAVFVAASGGSGKDADAARILRLNPDTLAVQAEINLERKGFGVVLDDEADRLYVGNTSDASITVIDTAANRVIGVVQLAEKASATGPDGKKQERYPHNFREMVIDKVNSRLYAPGLWFKDSALYVLDTHKLALETVIPGFGFVATGIALDSHHNNLYVSNLQGQLYTVGTRSLAIRDKVEVRGDQLLNLVVDNKRNRVLATDQGVESINGMRQKLGGLQYQNRGDGNRVVVINPADGSVLHSLPTGQGPVALLLDEQRDRLYVTNRDSGTVTIYAADDYRLLHTINLPTHPNSLALDEKTGTVFVSIKNGKNDPKGSNESVARLTGWSVP